MKRKLRKSLSWLLTVAMIFSLFCGMIPTASAAGFYSSIYQDDDKGISIELERSNSATNPKQVAFTVIVDNKTVLSNSLVSGVPADNVTLKIAAVGYDVTFPTTNGCAITSLGSNWLLDLHQVVEDEFSVTINLASEKQSDNITIQDQNQEITYGTFSWAKATAATSAFSRTLYVYVNDEEEPVYQQNINTPLALAAGEYWFTPNTALYKSDYTMEPSTLDNITLTDVRVYLTTVCGCGNSPCYCEGGCECPQDCTCDNCTGANLDENQIPTGYGILEYEPGDYQLTVQVYVNGNQKYESDPLWIRSGQVDSLNFNPGNGYYIPKLNAYDLITRGSGSTWDPSTGYISIVGILEEDKSFDNVLKIYLTTFEAATYLNVDRGVTVSNDDVTGYLISFEAQNPETGEWETYTYEATSFATEQPQHIPIGRQVTLTAICASGKEVTQWSSAEGYINVVFTGILGGNGSNLAYGNVAYFTLEQATARNVYVVIDEVDDVEVPTDDQLKTALNNIVVKCTNDEKKHESVNYALDMSSVTRPTPDQVTGNALNGYPYMIQIKSDSYVTKYNNTNTTHTPSTETKNVTLVYDGKDWTVQDAETNLPVTFEVSCDDGTGTDPQPKTNKVRLDLYENGELTFENREIGKYEVGSKLQEIAEELDLTKYHTHDKHAVDCEIEWYQKDGETPLGDSVVKGEGNFNYIVCKIYDVFPVNYHIGNQVKSDTFSVKDFGEKLWTPDLEKGQTFNGWYETIKDLEEGKNQHETFGWKLAKLELYGEITNAAIPGPTKPDENTIPEILGGKDAILVNCVSEDVNHALYPQKTYNLWADGSDGKNRYDVNDVTYNEKNKIWTCDVTILPGVYVEQYNADTKTTHWLAPAEQTGVTVTLTAEYNEEAGTWTWTAPKKGTQYWAKFDVACVPEKPADADIPEILDADEAILVKCGNTENKHDLDEKTYDLWENNHNNDGINRYTVGTPSPSVDGGWTCVVTLNPETYWKQYIQDTGSIPHEPTNPGQEYKVVLTWNAQDQKWVAEALPEDSPYRAIIEVTCEEKQVPTMPDEIKYEDLKDLINVKVVCDTSPSHAAKLYELIQDSYTCVVDQTSGKATVTVDSNKYVALFNDAAPGHSTVGTKQIILTWDFGKGQWITENYTVSFHVTCTDKVEEDPSTEYAKLKEALDVTVECVKGIHADKTYELAGNGLIADKIQGTGTAFREPVLRMTRISAR